VVRSCETGSAVSIGVRAEGRFMAACLVFELGRRVDGVFRLVGGDSGVLILIARWGSTAVVFFVDGTGFR
jgi:hypothetical protein